MKQLVIVIVLLSLSNCGSCGTPAAPSSVQVAYSVTGTAQRVSLVYRNSTGGQSSQESTVPFSYTFTAHTGDFLSISAQIINANDPGSIHVAITKNGAVCQSGDAIGVPNLASASCTA